MSYASGTTHYNLPQTVGTDKRDWTDTNQAFSDVDTALYGAVQDAETATSGIQTINAALEVINGKLATDEGNISTLSGKVSTLESTVGTQGTAIADVRQDLQDNIESKTEASATSTHAYAIGDTFYYNDVLYKATAPIAIGGTIVPSTNCTAITVMSEMKDEIDDLNCSKGYVEVTSDASIDTLGKMIRSLYTAANLSKITPFAKIVNHNGYIYDIQLAYNNSLFTFATSYMISATVGSKVIIGIDSSSESVTDIRLAETGITLIDNTNAALSPGVTWRLYY